MRLSRMILMESLSKQPLLHLLCRLLAQKKRDPEQDQQILMLLIYTILGKDNILLEDTAFSVILEMGRVLGIQVRCRRWAGPQNPLSGAIRFSGSSSKIGDIYVSSCDPLALFLQAIC